MGFGGRLIEEARGRIPAERQLQAGRALSLSNDAGFGGLVREGKRDGRFADELVDAALELFRSWAPEPAPEWITCVPSAAHMAAHMAVADFTQRLASALGLPFHEVLARVRPTRKALEAVKDCGLKGLVLDARGLGRTPAETVTVVRAFAEAAQGLAPNLIVHGLEDSLLIEVAKAAGMTHASVRPELRQVVEADAA